MLKEQKVVFLVVDYEGYLRSIALLSVNDIRLRDTCDCRTNCFCGRNTVEAPCGDERETRLVDGGRNVDVGRRIEC
jgi:hypothetical protein